MLLAMWMARVDVHAEDAPQYSDTERGHWSLVKRARPAAPQYTSEEDRRWVRNFVDAFILEGLTKNGLRPAPEADRRTLIRRLSFDLTGLPPTPAEIDAFID